jgi:hypothetical protein
MDPCLVDQIEAGNHARAQEAHMYSDSDDQESARQAHVHEAQSAARLRSQRQQPSDHAETGKPFLPCKTLQQGTLLTESQVPESEDATTTQEDAAAADSAEEILAKLTMSSGLGDEREKSRGESSRGEGQTFRHQCKSTYCAGQPPHEHDLLDEPEWLRPRRDGSSSSPTSDSHFSAYRAEKTAVSAPTLSSTRPNSSSSGPNNSTQEQRPGQTFRYECKSTYCAGKPPHEHDLLDDPFFLRPRPSHDGREVSRENENVRAPRASRTQQTRPRLSAPYKRYGEVPARRGAASVPVSDEVEGLSRALSASMAPSAEDSVDLL